MFDHYKSRLLFNVSIALFLFTSFIQPFSTNLTTSNYLWQFMNVWKIKIKIMALRDRPFLQLIACDKLKSWKKNDYTFNDQKKCLKNKRLIELLKKLRFKFLTFCISRWFKLWWKWNMALERFNGMTMNSVWTIN